MSSYRVRWEIDIEADSPREAAEKAREIQQQPDTWAVVFDVAPNSNPKDFETIDLDEELDSLENHAEYPL